VSASLATGSYGGERTGLGAAAMRVGYNLNVENSVGEIDVVECEREVTLQTNIISVCLCHFKSFE